MKKELAVKKEFPYNVIHSWRDGNPFTIAFVYPKKGEPFIVKGGANDVNPFLGTLKTPCIAHIGYWKGNKCRYNGIKFFGFNSRYKIYCQSRWPKENRKTYDDIGNPIITKSVRNVFRHRLMVFDERAIGEVFNKSFRHVPRKWIKELDQFLA
ncbi:MAG: hypothetical protein WC119_00710 [Synergistaceae bacterium]